MVMKRSALLATLFWIGAFLTGLIVEVIDVYWIGHPSSHSKSALLQIQTVAVLITATSGAILYVASLVIQKLQFVTRPFGAVLISLLSGATYSTILGLSGQGVLILSGGTTGIGWMFLLLLPIGLSLLMRSSRFQG